MAMEDAEKIAWYHTFFDEDYLKYWSFVLTPEKTQKEIEFVLQALALPEGSHILDLCCGQGRHALEFARMGYQVTGLDISETLLNHARKSAEEQNLLLKFVHSDMRDIPFTEEFDAIVNLFNAFGYLEEDEEDEKVIKAVTKALKTKGKFLIDLLSYKRLLMFEHKYNQSPNLAVENSVDVLSGRFKARWLITDDNGEQKERILVQRIYTFTEFNKMLKSSGLQVKKVFGGFDGSNYEIDSNRMIVLAEKI